MKNSFYQVSAKTTSNALKHLVDLITNKYKGIYLLLFLLFSITQLHAEGTQSLAPSVNDEVGLYVGAGQTPAGDYGLFAWKDSPAKLSFNIQNVCEKAYLGFSIPKDNRRFRASDAYEDLIFRIIDPNGNPINHPCFGNTIISSERWQTLSLADANIASRAELDMGIIQLGGTGYTGFEFDLAACGGLSILGDYSIEFYTTQLPYDPNTNSSGFYIEYFDITVADCSNMALTGRVWSNNWGLGVKLDGDGPFDRAFNGAFYVCSKEGFISKIDFNSGLNSRAEAGKNNDQRSGFRAGAFNVSFNSTGVGITGDIENDRLSLQDINSPNAELRVYLNLPNETLCPEQEVGQILASTKFLSGCGVNRCFNIEANKVGQVELLIESKNNADGNYDPPMDRILAYNITEADKVINLINPGFDYVSCIPWDGKDGLGNFQSIANTSVKLSYSQGIYHFPVYDVEFNDDGFTVETVRPNLGAQKLFYNDILILEDNLTGEPKDGLNGCDAPCHRWTGEYEDFSPADRTNIYGNFNTINTWWSANRDTFDFTSSIPEARINITCPPDYFGCPDVSIEPNITGMPMVDKSGSDCPINIRYIDNILGDDDCDEIIERLWIVTIEDVDETSDSCIQLLVFKDTIAPIIENCPPDVTIDVGDNCEASLDWMLPMASDNCPEGLIVEASQDPTEKFPLGITTVIITATDACGNSSNCSFQVTVRNPTIGISCPPDYTGCPGDDISPSLLGTAVVTNTKGCPAIVTYIDMDDPNATHCAEGLSIKRIWMAYLDGYPSGMVMCIQRITLDDSTKPVFMSCPPDVTLEGGENCQAKHSWEMPIAVDNCSGTTITSSHTPDYMFSVGTTVVTFTATDSCGNSQTCSFTVTVNECEPCEIRASDQTCFWIERVALGDIDNTSGKDNGYGDYTDLCTDLKLGSTQTITLYPGFPLNHTFDPYWFVWIDYNKDGDFEDPGEYVLTKQSDTTVMLDFIVPNNAKIGKTIMRIALKYVDEPDPCKSFVFGEVEDYCVNITSDDDNFVDNSQMGQNLVNNMLVPSQDNPVSSASSRSKISEGSTPDIAPKLYPNPVNQVLTLELGRQSMVNSQLTIYNSLGQIVYERSFQNPIEAQILIPVERFENGMYLLSFEEKGFEPIIKKFTKF